MKEQKQKAFIFDLDGTLYLGDEIIPGASETIQWVRKNDAKIRFVTNNPRFSREFYFHKLNTLGIEAKLDEIVTSSQLTANYLRNYPQYEEVFIIGEEQLRKELLAVGVNTVEHADADTVIVSFDTTLTYEKLMTAYHALKAGARFIATNPDAVCPTPDGGLVDAGAIIAALEISTGRKVEQVIGKPSQLLAELLIAELGIPGERCVVVGDRLNTDIRLGNGAGMLTAWIRAYDEALPTDLAYQPDLILSSIAELPEAMGSFMAQDVFLKTT